MPGVEGVPLRPTGRGGDDGRAAHLVEGRLGPGALDVEVLVERGHVGLLGVELVMQVLGGQGGASSSKVPRGTAFKYVRPASSDAPPGRLGWCRKSRNSRDP